MENEYLNRNMVFIGEFKPAGFDKLYLIKTGLLLEDAFMEGSVFLPDLTIIDTKNFILEINQNNFSINFKDLDFEIEIDTLIEVLKNSKISAFGFNFKRVLFITDFSESKKYFFIEKNLLNKFFDSEDTAYGYYVSKNFEDSRLKLDIKPVQLQRINESQVLNAMDFNFNFHFEESGYSSKLKKYKLYEQLTSDIINNYE